MKLDSRLMEITQRFFTAPQAVRFGEKDTVYTAVLMRRDGFSKTVLATKGDFDRHSIFYHGRQLSKVPMAEYTGPTYEAPAFETVEFELDPTSIVKDDSSRITVFIQGIFEEVSHG